MYLEYWQLREKPFELTPDPKYVYYAKGHEEAFLRLLYTVRDSKGAMLLTGVYGCGKTILSRVFYNELVHADYEVALITNPRFSAKELLVEMIYQLGGERHDYKTKGELLHIFNQMVYQNLEQGKETVVMIDEAQAIEDLDTFEELRLLLNFQQNDRFLLSLILIGQSELRDRLERLPQLKQRLMINYHLEPLDEQDTINYVDHRVEIAGGMKTLFSLESKKQIYQFSKGIPRVINGLADTALLMGLTQNRKTVDQRFMAQVIEANNMEPIWSV